MPPDPTAKPKFTVVTTTFNRATVLPRLYASLAAQSFRDFEWLIVDNGSTDDTRALVEPWLTDPEICVRYQHQPHGGKHTAFNTGVDLALGQLFISLDPGHACTPDALEKLDQAWQSIDPHMRSGFTGVCCLVMDPNGDVIGDRFPDDVFDSDSNAMRFKHRVGGEKWGFHRLDVVREFRFPQDAGLHYVPESIVWSRIASRYKERFVNDALGINFGDAEVNPIPASWQDPRPFALATKCTLEEQAGRWISADPAFFMKAAANFSRHSWLEGTNVVAQGRQLTGSTARGLWLMALPVGRILYWRDLGRRRASSPPRARLHSDAPSG